MSVVKIQCSDHRWRPAWLACKHVMRRETPAEHIQLPDPKIKDDAGVVSCKACLRTLNKKAISLVCDPCLREIVPTLPHLEAS